MSRIEAVSVNMEYIRAAWEGWQGNEEPDPARLLSPLFHPHHGPPRTASGLTLNKCDPQQARQLVALWHSRLPVTQKGPWIRGYVAHCEWTAYGAALWHNPSARALPGTWLELRRLAIADDAPHCSASWMLAAMRKDIMATMPHIDRLISYQDEDVHTGTIYKAAGWTVGRYQPPTERDRSTTRPGGRLYRTSINGAAPDVAGKYRWEISAVAG